MLSRTLASLAVAVDELHAAAASPTVAGGDSAPVMLTFIDNGAASVADAMTLPSLDSVGTETSRLGIEVLAGHGNVGYGVGHNLAIVSARSRYHLILNPDVDLAPRALAKGIAFLDRHPEVVALSPRIMGDDGHLQYLCRRYPSLADLFIRGFLPRRWRHHFDARLARYEMRADLDRVESLRSTSDDIALFPEIISGCFMLFRTEALQGLGGFDPRYFLYFEDYDLSLRASDIGKLAYVPSVEIVHYGGGAARKGSRHIRMFVRSAAQFFHRFGWRLR